MPRKKLHTKESKEAYRKAWRARNKEKVALQNARARKAMRERRPTYNRDWYRKRKLELAGRPPEACDICNVVGGFGVLHWDHDHVTGKFRGWLCNRCNTVLGRVRDSIELLQGMQEYLKKHGG